MSISLIFAAAGALVAAIGSGVLLARTFRAPRPDLVAWSIASVGLLISLGAQALGYLTGFDSAMFRGMMLGAQVIAPLALILGLAEVASRGLAGRFCARVYIPALAIVAFVVLALDQLTDTAFTKHWPNPAIYYQDPPNFVLMFAVGPLTALITLITVGIVARRSSRPGWNAVLSAQLSAGLAALLLAYPALVQLVKYVAHIGLPIRSEFSLICAAAAGLTWFAGVNIARLDVRQLRRDGGGRRDGPERNFPERPDAGRDRAAWQDDHGYGPDDRIEQTGDFDRRFDMGGQGLYRDGGLYRPDPHDGEEPGGHGDEYGWHDGHDGGDYDDFRTGDYDLGPEGAGRGRHPGDRHDDADLDHYDDRGGRRSRGDLFGQIAIYTLLEDRVAEFDQLTERMVADVRAMEPDTLVFIIHAVPSAPMQRILYEVYRSRDAYEWHRHQPYVAQFEVDRRPFVLATNVIELGLQQGKVIPFPSVEELFPEPGYDTSGFERPDYVRDYGRPPTNQGESRDRQGR